MSELFSAAFSKVAADKLVDRTELGQLRELKNHLQKTVPGSDEAKVAARTLQSLDQYKSQQLINHPVKQPDGKTVYFDFTISPLYSESELVPGKNPLEQVANLSQGDLLADTKQDNYRCAASTVLNAYLLLGGKFENLPAKLGLSVEHAEMTYANVHRVQEALYLQANINGGNGLNTSYSNRYDFQNGKVLLAEIVGESRIAAGKLGLKTHALTGNNRDSLNQRTHAVNAFLQANPQAAIYLTVKGGPPVTAPRDFEKYDHAVTLYHDKGKFYLLDTGVNDNGGNKALTKLSPERVKELLYENQAYVFGLTLEANK